MKRENILIGGLIIVFIICLSLVCIGVGTCLLYTSTFKLGKKIMHLYPYCGNLERIRVGEDGDNYYIFEHEQKKADKLRNTLNKYCNLKEYQGIYEW